MEETLTMGDFLARSAGSVGIGVALSCIYELVQDMKAWELRASCACCSAAMPRPDHETGCPDVLSAFQGTQN